MVDDYNTFLVSIILHFCLQIRVKISREERDRYGVREETIEARTSKVSDFKLY